MFKYYSLHDDRGRKWEFDEHTNKAMLILDEYIEVTNKHKTAILRSFRPRDDRSGPEMIVVGEYKRNQSISEFEHDGPPREWLESSWSESEKTLTVSENVVFDEEKGYISASNDSSFEFTLNNNRVIEALQRHFNTNGGRVELENIRTSLRETYGQVPDETPLAASLQFLVDTEFLQQIGTGYKKKS